ncbi:MAG: toxin-antitoxin system YwqK family antitoxin [Aureispira sp.]
MRYDKLWILILSFSACTTASHETVSKGTTTQEVLATELTFDRQRGLALLAGEPFCGLAVRYQDSLKVATTTYKFGRKHGRCQKWFEEGALSYEAYYKNGKQDSITRTWWKNGTLRSEAHFKEGRAEGLQLSWYRSGAKFKAIQLVHGKEDGLQKAWRENGKIYNNYEAKNGRIFGLKRAALCYELEEEEIQ